MKTAVRFLVVVALGMLVWAAPETALAESRGKAIKRAEKEIRQGNFDEAEKIYRHLIEKDLQDREARLGLSFTLIKKLKLQEAYEEAAQVIAAEPLSARAHSLMGTALLRSGEFRNSVEALRTALQLNNREALALAGLSEIAYFENRSRIAYEGLKQAILIEPNEPDYYISLARACSRIELYSEAADAYQRFLEVAPKTDAERRARIRGLIDFYRYLGNTKLHRTGGPEVSTTNFELHGNRPFVRVMINGRGPLKFVIDTGASLSVISETAAEKLGIRPVAKGGNARAVGGTGSFPIVYTVLESVVIGEARIDMVPAYIRTVHVTSDTPENERADGYLGLSILSNYAVTLDYQSRMLTLDRTTPRAEKTPAEAAAATEPVSGDPAALLNIPVPIRSTSGGLASAEANLPKMERPLNFIIDTGASVTVVSKAAVRRNGLEDLKMPNERTRVIGAAGIEDGVESLALSSLTVNGLRQNNARALILDLDPVNETSGFEQHGILGGDFLRHFKVQMDLRRYELRLTPQSKAIRAVANTQ
ncbi:MAG TPA: aspartyl protease family protein [Blastocatellia bacterium]|nr:aspartyl protease family protein [Blastocatellia bacterium]